MANPVIETNYAGEVLDEILTITATKNEMFQHGLVRVITGVRSSINIPRMLLSQLLQKRKSSPVTANSKGNINIKDLKITPQDVMVYFEFNPREFEKTWRPFQPTGELVHAELPDKVKVKLIDEVLAQVSSELGAEMLIGTFGDNEGQYFDGFVTRIMRADDKVVVTTSETSMIKRLQAMWEKTTAKVRGDKNFTFLLSAEDADKYGEELAALPSKGTDPSAADRLLFKGKRVVGLNDMPEGLMIATICSLDTTSNLIVACSMASDAEAVVVEKTMASSEDYFVKLLMKYDTGVAFTSLCTVLDARSGVTLSAQDVPAFTVNGGTKTCNVTAPGEITATPAEDTDWITLTVAGSKITVVATANATGAERNGSFTVTSGSQSVTVEVSQAGA